MTVRVGVDVGGTFTDIVLALDDGALRVSKVSSTPEDPCVAVIEGLAALLRAANVEPAAIAEIVHGTTVASRAVTIERGRDPRDFTLVAFGGSGPVHACDVAAALDIRRVLVPVFPGVFTAVGMLASDVEHHFVRAAGGALGDDAALEPTRARLAELRREALATLAAEGYPEGRTRLDVQADLRYAGQGSELVVPVPGGALDVARLAELRAAFQKEYALTYGYTSDEELELVNVRVIATGLGEHRLDFRSVAGAGEAVPPAARRRAVAFVRGAPAIDTPVIARAAVGATPEAGPLIVESYDSTVVVPPDATIARDGIGNLLITSR